MSLKRNPLNGHASPATTTEHSGDVVVVGRTLAGQANTDEVDVKSGATPGDMKRYAKGVKKHH